MAKWYTAPCLLRAGRMVMGSSPGPNLHQCLWTRLQVCGLKRLGHHADLYTVSRCRPRGESENQRENASKGSTLTLKPRADVTRSPKQGHQWPHEKDLCPPKLKKNVTFYLSTVSDTRFHVEEPKNHHRKVCVFHNRHSISPRNPWLCTRRVFFINNVTRSNNKETARSKILWKET